MDNHISDDQLLLFRSLFKAREDVFAMHWVKGAKSGYAPAKLYDPYIMDIPLHSTPRFRYKVVLRRNI